MRETASEIFAKIAIEKGYLTDEKVKQARTAQKAARKEKRPAAIETVCVELGLLTKDQARGIERGLRYYVVRKVDRKYAQIAISLGFADQETVKNCLHKQHDEFFKNKKLVRLSKLLIGLDALTGEQDEKVRTAVVSKLTPEESAGEADAVKVEEKAPAATSDEELAVAEKVAASADSDDAVALKIDDSDDEKLPPLEAPPAKSEDATAKSDASSDALLDPSKAKAAGVSFSDDDTVILKKDDSDEKTLEVKASDDADGAPSVNARSKPRKELTRRGSGGNRMADKPIGLAKAGAKPLASRLGGKAAPDSDEGDGPVAGRGSILKRKKG